MCHGLFSSGLADSAPAEPECDRAAYLDKWC